MPSVRFRLLDDVPDSVTIKTRFSVSDRAVGLCHGEHIREVYVITWQLLSEVGDHVGRQNRLSAHDETGQVPGTLGCLSTVQEQSP
jgi:hypothetical protein